jgi:hypothetical protein
MHSGLYWPSSGSDAIPSPLGELAAQAEKDGYSRQGENGPRPFYGYFFRILKRQGAAAEGGARNYVVNGAMTEGFAMLATPAEYLSTGIMTFIIGPEGVVYESDLGAETARVAAAIDAFNPDTKWRPVAH